MPTQRATCAISSDGRAVSCWIGTAMTRQTSTAKFMRKPSQSLLASKDCEGFLMNFAVLVCRVIAVPIQQDTALPSEEIAHVARCVGIPDETRDRVGDAQIGRATCRESGCQYA